MAGDPEGLWLNVDPDHLTNGTLLAVPQPMRPAVRVMALAWGGAFECFGIWEVAVETEGSLSEWSTNRCNLVVCSCFVRVCRESLALVDGAPPRARSRGAKNNSSLRSPERILRRWCVTAAPRLVLLLALAIGLASGCADNGANHAGLPTGSHSVFTLVSVNGRAFKPCCGTTVGNIQLDIDNPEPGAPTAGLAHVLPLRSAVLWSPCGGVGWEHWDWSDDRMSFDGGSEIAASGPCDSDILDMLGRTRAVMMASPSVHFDGKSLTMKAGDASVAFVMSLS